MSFSINGLASSGLTIEAMSLGRNSGDIYGEESSG